MRTLSQRQTCLQSYGGSPNIRMRDLKSAEEKTNFQRYHALAEKMKTKFKMMLGALCSETSLSSKSCCIALLGAAGVM